MTSLARVITSPGVNDDGVEPKEQSDIAESMEVGPPASSIGICSHSHCAQARRLVIHVMNVFSSLCDSSDH